MKNINPTKTKAWDKLQRHFEEIKDLEMKQLFTENPARANELTLHWEDFYLDLSKNRITEETQKILVELAEECGLAEAIQSYYKGEAINQTENRPVLHTALRTSEDEEVLVDGENVMPEVYQVKEKIKKFSNSIIEGTKLGYTGLPFTDVVNIGIGGSDLGPAMVTEALKFYKYHLNRLKRRRRLRLCPNILWRFPAISRMFRNLVLTQIIFFLCGTGLAADFHFGARLVYPLAWQWATTNLMNY